MLVCVVSVLCSLVVTCWERAELLAVVFSHFPKCVLVHISIKGEVGAVKLVKALQLNILLTVPRRYFFCGSFMFLFCLVFAMFCARLFVCALWSPAGKGLTSWLSFVVSSVSLSLSHWYPGSGVVLDCIDS